MYIFMDKVNLKITQKNRIFICLMPKFARFLKNARFLYI